MNYLNSVADLGTKLRESGLLLDETKYLELMIRNPISGNSQRVEQIVEEMMDENLDVDYGDAEQFLTSTAMKAKAGAAYAVAGAQLDQVMMDL